MDASLGGIAALAAAVGVTGQPVHDGPADAARLVDLKTQVVVRTGHGMVVLVHHEMRTAGAPLAALVEVRIGWDR